MLAPVAAAAAVSLTLVGYGVMSPRSQLFGPQLWRLKGGSKNCALTFDDGPQEPYTSRLLDLLAAEGVAATFFVLGRQVERYPGLLARLCGEGHEVGIHGYSHAAVPLLRRARMAEELDRTLSLVEGAKLVRPPYGWKSRCLFRLAAERGLRVVGWSAHGGDWRPRTGQQIARKILRRVRPGAIVLLHDGCGEDPAADRSGTILATAILIRELKGQGFTFVTLRGCQG